MFNNSTKSNPGNTKNHQKVLNSAVTAPISADSIPFPIPLRSQAQGGPGDGGFPAPARVEVDKLNDGALGILTKYVSAARKKRFDLQEIVSSLLPDERVCWCCKRVYGGSVEIRKADNHCYYHGLAKCGSVWFCPVCAFRISEVRRAELDQASAAGYTQILVTLTFQHNAGDKLDDLLNSLNDACRKLRGRRAWRKLEEKYGIVASVSALEITISQDNGFHPHKHIDFFSSLPEDKISVDDLRNQVSSMWRSVLDGIGEYASDFAGVDVKVGNSNFSGYVSKWGITEEVVKSGIKKGKAGHLSIWQLVELAGVGDLWAITKFKEYALAVKGRRWLFWSKGARDLFGLGKDQDDQVISESEPEEPEVVCSISRLDWSLVLRRRARASLLDAADQGGSNLVFQFLDKLRYLERLDAYFEKLFTGFDVLVKDVLNEK